MCSTVFLKGSGSCTPLGSQPFRVRVAISPAAAAPYSSIQAVLFGVGFSHPALSKPALGDSEVALGGGGGAPGYPPGRARGVWVWRPRPAAARRRETARGRRTCRGAR